jgi:lipoprotein-releasing system ATP-binding protein
MKLVSQEFYVLENHSVEENIFDKMIGYTNEDKQKRANKILTLLELTNLRNTRAKHLSSGQKQRVAIARALINDPLIIMGDEPTGNLDKKNSEVGFEIFQELANTYNQTLLIVTHDNEFAARTKRTIEMEDGKIIRM